MRFRSVNARPNKARIANTNIQITEGTNRMFPTERDASAKVTALISPTVEKTFGHTDAIKGLLKMRARFVCSYNATKGLGPASTRTQNKLKAINENREKICSISKCVFLLLKRKNENSA